MTLRRSSILAFTVLAIAAAAFAAPKPSSRYAGEWTLDKTQSKNLPRFYERIQSHTLTIKSSDALFDVAVTITMEKQEPDHFDFPYPTDGSEASTKTKVRTPDGPVEVPTVLKLSAADDGGLTITIARTIKFDGTESRAVTEEHWELQPDGKTLRIRKTDEMPRGKMESELVFIRS